MPQQTSPFLEGKYGWNYGESGWNSGMDENMLKFSFMFDGNIDSIVVSLPSPSAGTAHFLTTDNRLYFSVGLNWYSSPTPKWFTVRIKSSGLTYQFDGTQLISVPNNSSLSTSIQQLQANFLLLGTASTKATEFFASKTQLDTSLVTANDYTDSKLVPVNTAISTINTALTAKQPLDPSLTALAGINTSTDTFIYATGVDTFQTTPLTSFSRGLLSSSDSASARSTLGTTSLVQGNVVSTTTGTSVDFLNVPPNTKKITLIFNGVSTTGASGYSIQIGSGAADTSGYSSFSSYMTATAVSGVTVTNGFHLRVTANTEAHSGLVTICNLTGNTWIASGLTSTPGATSTCSGTKTLSGVIDRIRLISTNGVDSLDLGNVNVIYEG